MRAKRETGLLRGSVVTASHTFWLTSLVLGPGTFGISGLVRRITIG
jgi:hypothetical protein